ncbi:MAG: sigma-70 family RNA polymerase sigma factor [Verrucomicrobia subdivision 3 bacterium]|nr:sigma-70 family RNA polymerase sigma factor [Limisphaerales bacterium]
MTEAVNSTPGTSARFQDTHWSLVLHARDGGSPRAAAALESLCRAYWYPLYAYVRRCGESPEDAHDLTQAFFARFLQRDSLRAVTPERGRFRWFLLASLKHFLANEWERARAQKRGGGQSAVSLDALEPEDRYAFEPVDSLSADKAYDRFWAMSLLEQARAKLREEFRAAGRGERFEKLEQFLPGQAGADSYAELAVRFGLSEGAIKSDVSRLRRRYGELLRAEVAHTLGTHTDLEDELHHLLDALA